MTGDPAEEAEYRRQARGLESLARHGPPAGDPLHTLRIHMADGIYLYAVGRWSLCNRLTCDAADTGPGQVEDLGVNAMGFARSLDPEDIPPNRLLHIGLARGGRWLAWYPPCPAEPVPGSPEARGQRN